MGYLITGLITLTVTVIAFYFVPKGKLVYWSPHNFRFKVKTNENKDFEFQTDSLSLQNIGHKTVENIEVIFKQKPDHFQISPIIPYNTEELKEGGYVIKINSLGVKEYFTLQFFSYLSLPSIDNIRSSLGAAQLIPFQIQRLYSKPIRMILLLIFIVGIVTILYLLYFFIKPLFA